MSKPKKSAKNAPVTARELKAWIEGIHAFQPKGWTPSREQWDAVCDKISALEEYEASYQDTTSTVVTPSYAPQYTGSALGGGALGGGYADAPINTQVRVGNAGPTDTGLIDAKPTLTEGGYTTNFA